MSSVDIPPFLSYIRADYLHSHTEGQGYFSDATPFAIVSTVGEYLKFHIVSVHTTFFNIPVNAITNSKTSPILSEDDASFLTCPSDDVETIQYDHLTNVSHCGVWKQDGSFWQLGSYVLSIEWPRVKVNVHLIELEDGNYIVWDGDFITWGEDVPESLPKYGK